MIAVALMSLVLVGSAVEDAAAQGDPELSFEGALTAEQIKEIVAQPHSRKDLVEELNIFPDVRTWSVQVSMTAADGEVTPSEGASKSTQKVVGGKFVVSEMAIDADGEPMGTMAMVSFWDADLHCYRKFTLTELNDQADPIVTESRGLTIGDSGVIAWTIVNNEADGGMTILIMEQLTEKRATFSQVIHDPIGLFVMKVEGVAVPVTEEE